MSDRIPHSRPTLPDPDRWDQVTGRLVPGWAADGPCVDAFAAAAAAWLGCTEGVAVNSGTSALHIALEALGAGSDSEVLVPAYCCAALLNAVKLAGATPVLVDSEPGGFNLSAEDARRKRTPRTRAAVVAHMFGVPVALEPFLELEIPVIEDCAQSIGAVSGGRLTGSRGHLAIGSFYATKVITTGHGGVAATSDPELAARLRDLVHYDNREDWHPRVNYNISELQAGLGLWQLERLPAFLARRRDLAHYYDEALGLVRQSALDASIGLHGATGSESWEAADPTPPPGFALRSGAGPIHFRYTLRVRDAAAIIGELQALGIDAKRPVYRPLHHYLGGEHPAAQAAHEEIVSLPIYPTLTGAAAAQVAEAVRRIAPALKSS